MYDRLISLQRFAARPLTPGGQSEPPPRHVHGLPVIRRVTGEADGPSGASREQPAAAIGKIPTRG